MKLMTLTVKQQVFILLGSLPDFVFIIRRKFHFHYLSVRVFTLESFGGYLRIRLIKEEDDLHDTHSLHRLIWADRSLIVVPLYCLTLIFILIIVRSELFVK